MDFQAWIFERSVDCNELTPELEQSLQAQYEADCQRSAPVAEVLLVPMDCQWPARGFWLPVVGQ